MSWDGPSILDVARESGREPVPRGSQYRVRCPDPTHADANPSCDLDDEANVFICRSCGAKGGVVEFAKLTRITLPRRASSSPWSSPVPARPAPAPAKAKQVAPTVAENNSLWNTAQPVLDDAEVVSWLGSRGLNAGDVELAGVARALPPSTFVPRWARSHGGFWPESNHRLLLRLFDAHGVNVGIRARRISEPDDGLPKSLSPCGLPLKGAVLANCLGQLLLSGGLLGDGSPAAELVRRAGVVFAEGEVDFMGWSTKASDSNEMAPAVFGIGNGWWTDELASRVPAGTTVTIRADDDSAGRTYALAIGQSLYPRCTVRVLGPRQ